MGANLKAKFKVAIFLLLFRKIANFLRRLDCKTFKEAKYRRISKGSWSIDDSNDKKETEEIMNEDPGEAGASIEFELLGTNLTSINNEAALYFLRLEFDDPKFTEHLIELNRKPELYVEMEQKGSKVSFKGKRCGVSLHPK